MTIYNKLIRDKIPEVIANNGQTAKITTLSDEEYVKALETKLQEEVAEYLKDKNTDELADIMEVVLALNETLGGTHESLEALRHEKAEKRGAFSQKLFLVSVNEGEDDE